MSKNEYFNPYWACVSCLNELKSKEMLGESIFYCDNEQCKRYGYMTLVDRCITAPEQVAYWRTKVPTENPHA